MTALNDFKFPKSFTIPVIVMIRFIPTVVDSIRDTEKSLGIKRFVKKRIIKYPIKSSEYILVPVLRTCLNSMDELAQASLARGFSLNQKRKNVLKLYFSIFDIAIILFFIAMLLHKRWI